MPSPSEARAETAKSLRDEARGLLADTGLFALLQDRFGEPTVTGSAGYDLMVWRDIDIDLAVELDAVGLTLHRATFRNEYVEPGPLGHGFSWSLEFRDFAGYPWEVAIRGWDPFDYAVRQARDFSLRTDLQASDRDLILRLKTEARQRTNYYGTIVTSWDIYQFCIAKAGDSLSALEMWKRKQ